MQGSITVEPTTRVYVCDWLHMNAKGEIARCGSHATKDVTWTKLNRTRHLCDKHAYAAQLGSNNG